MSVIVNPASGGGGSGMAIGDPVVGGTLGSVLFVGAGPVLAQDNAKFFWDDTLFDLHIGNSYFIGSSRAIFTIPNASGNNWFEGAAGNEATEIYALGVTIFRAFTGRYPYGNLDATSLPRRDRPRAARARRRGGRRRPALTSVS